MADSLSQHYDILGIVRSARAAAYRRRKPINGVFTDGVHVGFFVLEVCGTVCRDAKGIVSSVNVQSLG
jgi:hypothetical protein